MAPLANNSLVTRQQDKRTENEPHSASGCGDRGNLLHVSYDGPDFFARSVTSWNFGRYMDTNSSSICGRVPVHRTATR